MKLLNEFASALDRLSSDQTASISVADEQHSVRCHVTEAGPLACKFEKLVVESQLLADATSDRLRQISETLASRLTYLMEPMGPVEMDQAGCTVQMRSVPPRREEGAVAYFELLVQRGGSLTLTRFQKSAEHPRQPIAAAVTREVLVHLVQDLVQAIDPA